MDELLVKIGSLLKNDGNEILNPEYSLGGKEVRDYGSPEQSRLLSIYSKRLEVIGRYGQQEEKYTQVLNLVTNLKENRYSEIKCFGIYNFQDQLELLVFTTKDVEKLIGVISSWMEDVRSFG